MLRLDEHTWSSGAGAEHGGPTARWAAAGRRRSSRPPQLLLLLSVSQSQGKGIQRALMTDAVHPTKAGWEALAKCLAPVVEAAYKG